jgi:hypothetical protein
LREPEVYESGLGRMGLKPIPIDPHAQHIQQSLARQMVFEGNYRIISVAVSAICATPAKDRSLRSMRTADLTTSIYIQPLVNS